MTLTKVLITTDKNILVSDCSMPLPDRSVRRRKPGHDKNSHTGRNVGLAKARLGMALWGKR